MSDLNDEYNLNDDDANSISSKAESMNYVEGLQLSLC